MTRLLEFAKTTAIGGLLVIVPITVILFVVAQLFYGLYGIAATLVEQLPANVRNEVPLIIGITVLSIVGLCFLTGLVVQTRFGAALSGWFGRNVAPRIPMYNAISNLTKRVVGVDGHEFAPVEVDLYGGESRAIGLLIETLPDDRSAVFVPSAPVATVGNVIVIPNHCITPINASTKETIGVVTQWGVEAKNLYRTR